MVNMYSEEWEKAPIGRRKFKDGIPHLEFEYMKVFPLKGQALSSEIECDDHGILGEFPNEHVEAALKGHVNIAHSRATKTDSATHPAHYTSHPSGVECITITEHFGFNVGNAIKYLWRAGLKSPDASEDLRKALWYVQREIERIKK